MSSKLRDLSSFKCNAAVSAPWLHAADPPLCPRPWTPSDPHADTKVGSRVLLSAIRLIRSSARDFLMITRFDSGLVIRLDGCFEWVLSWSRVEGERLRTTFLIDYCATL